MEPPCIGKYEVWSPAFELEKAAWEALARLQAFRRQTAPRLYTSFAGLLPEVVLHAGRFYTCLPVTDLSLPLRPVGGGEVVCLSIAQAMVAATENRPLATSHALQPGDQVDNVFLKEPAGVYEGRLVWTAAVLRADHFVSSIWVEPTAPGAVYTTGHVA